MQVSMSDGTRLEVETIGAGPPLVWLPGGPGLANYLRPVAAGLPGFRHVLADPRGTGRSEGGPHEVDLAVQDLEDLRTALGFDHWTVIGHSWGADLALAYALAHGGAVRSVVSFAGTGLQNDRDWHAAYSPRIEEEPHGAYASNQDVHDVLLASWRALIKAPDLLARVAALTTPITFLHSANDIRPGWPARQLAHLVPRGRFVELADAPHEAWLTHSTALVATLGGILAQTEASPMLASTLDHDEIVRRYGPWQPRTPGDAAQLFAGYPGRWWVAGGRAIEAFTGVRRPHGDLDVSIPRSELALLRPHLLGRLDVWAADRGTLRPLVGAGDQDLPATAENLWLRPSGAKPWEYDVILMSGTASTWTYKRDARVGRPLGEILWVRDGISYLRPEVQLLHKALGLRARDQEDFEACRPRLDADARRWLRDAISLAHPGHPWLADL